MLKPFKVDVYFYYKCPTCGAEWQQSYMEVKEIGKIVCFCNTVIKLEKMNGVKITPNYPRDANTMPKANTIPKASPVPKVISMPKANNKYDIEDIIKGMTKIGFKKHEAKEAVDTVLCTGNIYNAENDFFQACLQSAYNKKKATK